jgi:hypothetical protein
MINIGTTRKKQKNVILSGIHLRIYIPRLGMNGMQQYYSLAGGMQETSRKAHPGPLEQAGQ